MKLIRTFLFVGIISIILSCPAFAQSVGSVGGQVVDTLGAVIVGATVTAAAADGKQKQAISNARGEFSITGLAPGTYTVKGIANKFALYANAAVIVTAGGRSDLTVVLTVAGVQENVEVSNSTGVSTDADNNKDATVISGKDLDALPDDPDELQSALMALAGAAAGPNGGQIYIDGFTGGQLPPKESIREIRINQNPFSAEYDRLGFGRIEILTKPGSDKWRGSFNGRFNDESLNSRNPFALNRAPSQTRSFGGNLSGPIQKGKSSFFLDINKNEQDNNAIINAQILDPSFNIVGFRQDVRVPSKRFSIGPRVDYAINAKNTLVARYSFTSTDLKNQGIGDTSLLSRAYTTSNREHEIRLTETMIINPKTVNETRFEYSTSKRSNNGDNSIPTISVSSAFTGGGAQIGRSFNQNKSFELSNFTTTSLGKRMQHSVKFGGRVRGANITDRSENNFGGTFIFPGVPEIHSPAGCFPVNPPACAITLPALAPIDQYRGKVSGVLDPRVNPTQFTITSGSPLASVKQYDVGLFATDDWRISPALLLSFGLRYENQTNISSKFDFAPRFGFAWSPGAGGAKPPKTVFRGGAGVFYDRFSENNTLQTLRFNGVTQLSLLVNANDVDPVRRAAALVLLAQPVFTLSGVTNVPTAAQILAALPQSSTLRRVDSGLQAPYTMQIALGIERQLPAKMTLTTYFISSRSLHQLRTRNINAPVCPLQTNCNLAPRPQPTFGNINEYESSGTINSNRINVNLNARLGTKVSLSANYGLGFSHGDTDGGGGGGSNPAYAYDLSGEYGRTAGDIRQSFALFGNFTLPWGVSLSPFILAATGRPFNITRGGVDLNGDGILTERPTFGDLRTRCAEIHLTNSFCDIGSNDPASIIPRNYGQGPGNFSVNLRFGKTFGFGKSIGQKTASGGDGVGRGAGGGGMVAGPGGRGEGGGGGPMRVGGGGDVRKPYNLNFGVIVTNLFNHVNLANPVGILNSSRFGQSTSTIGGGFGGFGGGGGGAANRKVELQMRFNW